MDGTQLIFGLSSEWAILLAIFILTSVQLVKVIFDGARTKREKAQKEKSDNIMNQIEIYLRILSDKYTEEITERQLPTIFKQFLGHCREAIIVHGSTTITKNDIINNKPVIKAKVSQFIRNHFQTVMVDLGLFKWKGKLLSEFTKQTWCREVEENVLHIILEVGSTDKGEAYRQLISYVDSKFEFFITEAIAEAYEH